MLSRFTTKKKNKKDDFDSDPAVEAYKDHILANLSVNISTLLKYDWISSHNYNMLVETLAQHNMAIDPNTFPQSGTSAHRNSTITKHSYHSGPSPTSPAAYHPPPTPARAELAPPSYTSSAAPPLPARGPDPTFAAPPPPKQQPPVVAAPAPPPTATKPKPAPRAKPAAKPTVIAISDFDAVEQEDLPFRTGDIITILETVDENWYKGELRGKVGIFPKTYVQDR